MKMRRRAALALALALPGAGGAALAADYPTKPIKIVVPYAPGGGADAVARMAMHAVGNTPEEFAAFIQKDIATWKAVAAAAKVAVK